MENRSIIVASFILLPLLLTTISAQTTQLRPDFYRTSCPSVEFIVRFEVFKKLQQTFVTASGTLQLFFHDCFVRGVMRRCCWHRLMVTRRKIMRMTFPYQEMDLTLIKAKAAVDSNPHCRNKVSCADILALGTRDVILLTGGPFYDVELGRRDGRISTKASVENQLPHPNFNLNQLNSMFAKHGLTQTDMIALSGAHTLGFSHCDRFSNRIYNFSPGSKIYPTLNPVYASQLRQMCPRNVDPRTAINMDPTTPGRFDNVYFKNLQQGMGLFTSDQVLFTDPRSRNTVNLFASNNAAFQMAFVDAITKLGRVGVLTGNQGEIRRDCVLSA